MLHKSSTVPLLDINPDLWTILRRQASCAIIGGVVSYASIALHLSTPAAAVPPRKDRRTSGHAHQHGWSSRANNGGLKEDKKLLQHSQLRHQCEFRHLGISTAPHSWQYGSWAGHIMWALAVVPTKVQSEHSSNGGRLEDKTPITPATKYVLALKLQHMRSMAIEFL